jgi:hypothetical protein
MLPRVGYTGSIVVGRSEDLLVHEDGMDGFGHRHHYVRPLGDGWQLVETGGWIDPPELREPARTLAVSTGRPVFAAHVFDSDCAVLCTAIPQGAGLPTHLGTVDGDCWYRHSPGPASRTAAAIVAVLVDWAASADLRPDRAALKTAVTAGGPADDMVFDLVRGLGLRRIGPTLPRAIP